MSAKVLIAEDNDVTRAMMVGILENEGYEIFQAIDGGSAMKVVGDQPIDIALVDLHMAPEGGFDFIKHLTEKGIDIPVVLVTGDEGMDLLIETRKYKISRVLKKPVEADKLKMVVAKTLERYG